MAIKVFIRVMMGNQKINAIKAWRRILGTGHAKAGLTEAKLFLENNDTAGYFQVVFSDEQFGRFVLESATTCNGSQSNDFGIVPAQYKPLFEYHSPENFDAPVINFTI